ncbi:MAG: hypothetical protein JXR91_11045 [Deltaproteobacteria bacterium]|nr:hypothetical protein [Deltaproteobacteria bacterium]
MKYFLILLTMLLFAACQSDLDVAYDDFLSKAPLVCKDYCEEKNSCERATDSSLGTYDQDSFTTKIHQCIAICTSYKAEGAYIWNDASSLGYDRNYYDFIDGDSLFTGYECLYNLGAYRCVNSNDVYTHKLNAPTSVVCEESNNCLAPFNIDYSFYWSVNPDGFGGSCKTRGTDNIDAIFFY